MGLYKYEMVAGIGFLAIAIGLVLFLTGMYTEWLMSAGGPYFILTAIALGGGFALLLGSLFIWGAETVGGSTKKQRRRK